MAKTYTFPLTHDDKLIQSIVEHLDDIAVRYESLWGVGRLQELATEEIRGKWDRQLEKLASAIDRKHPEDVRTFCEGVERGWAALEAMAIAGGHKPLDKDNWQFRHDSGKVFNVYRNNADAVGQNGITLRELCNFYYANYKLPDIGCAANSEPDPKAWIDEAMGGDELPF